ncbi:TOPRIM nucleotidyl transferase/hydrolase domain-containing protein [Streptomyces diastaticus]|uniref:TOPRIM nucleotidyl transferase/hydrolase domain-containing protein n=1 Tax=Streptomyces diastaticus TaxID=1956 RepID=UPI003413CB7F
MAEASAFREAVGGWADGGRASERELAGRLGVRTAVLLEGLSDLAAVEALAARQGRDLAAEGVCVVQMGGAMNVGRYAVALGPPGLGLRLTGLCDVRERPFCERGSDRAGAPADAVLACSADLEDDLVRALGTARVEEAVRAEGDDRAWRTFLRRPAQLGRPLSQQLRRFLGTKKGRKIRYGHLLAEALGPGQVPAPPTDLFASL